MSAVRPSSLTRSRSGWCLKSARTESGFPRQHAPINGVFPSTFPRLTSTSRVADIIAAAVSARSSNAATYNAVSPSSSPTFGFAPRLKSARHRSVFPFSAAATSAVRPNAFGASGSAPAESNVNAVSRCSRSAAAHNAVHPSISRRSTSNASSAAVTSARTAASWPLDAAAMSGVTSVASAAFGSAPSRTSMDAASAFRSNTRPIKRCAR